MIPENRCTAIRRADQGEGIRERKPRLVVSYVLMALRGTVAWHTEQHRPYSASTDKDAITVIEQQQEAITALRNAVVEMEAYNDVPSAKHDPVWVDIRHRGAQALSLAKDT